MYITEGEKIKNMIIYGAKSALTLEQIIANEIKEWDASPVKNDMILGNAYYRYEQKSDIKSGFVRKLSKQKTDYLLSKPFSVTGDNKKYVEQLNEIFDDVFRAKIKNVGTQAVNKGIGWLQIYFDNNKPAFKVIPSEEIIPLWLDSEHTQLDGVIRAYYRTEYEGSTKKNVRHIEYWSSNGVNKYIYDGYGLVPDVEQSENSHFSINGKSYNWERVPFIAFKYNHDELPLIKGLKEAIDDYDNQKNVISGLLKSIPNFIYVLRNYGGADLEKFVEELKKYRVITVDDDGGVDKLQADINITAYDTYIQQARKDIYEFGRGVDTQAVDLGNASGQALKFRYADLDNDCNDMETEFSAAMQNVIWFLNQYFAITGKENVKDESVKVVFNRDIIINETETIQNCAISKDLISDETIAANHPWVTDAENELKKLEKQKEKESDWQSESFGIVKNTPPAGDVNEE